MYDNYEREIKRILMNCIIKLRKVNRLTQNNFAELMDYSREYIDKKEAQKSISLNYLIRAIKVLDIKFYEVLTKKYHN